MISGRPGQAAHRQSPGSDSEQSGDSRRVWAAAVFSLGVLFGMVMLGASVYADFEATLFDVFLNAASSPRLIDCPILLSSRESGIVSASIKNQGDTPIMRLVRAHISRGHLTLMREFEQRIELAPGEKVNLEWEVTEKDAAYGHLIFAKVIFLKDDRNPIQRGSCGILVLNLPFGLSGRTVVATMYIVSFICIILALGLWWRYGRSYTGLRMEATRAMFVLGVVVLVGLIFALLGWWEAAAGAFYLAILAIGVVVPHFLINLLRNRTKIKI